MKYLGKLKIRPSREIGESMVSIGFECLDRKVFNPEKCYDPLGESGVKHARVQTGWAVCEQERGRYDFAWLDDVVDKLLERGVLPWFNVGYGNPIYMPDAPNSTAVGCVPTLYGEKVTEAWLAFVRALTRHFRDRITYYEIWNEPDIRDFWHPSQPDAAQYAELISLTGGVIRSEFPGAQLGACTSGSDFGYVETLMANLRPGELDFYCMHRYTVFPELDWKEKVAQLRRIFARNGHNIRLWMGEGGYPSWFPKNHWMHPKAGNDGSERQQAVYQLRRYFQDAQLGLERHSFYQMADMWERPYEKAHEVLSKPAAQGVLNGLTYTKKRSYYTLSRLANLLSGRIAPLDACFMYRLSGDGADTLTASAVQYFTLKRNDMPMYAYYLPTDIQDECDPDFGFGFTAETFENVRPIVDAVLLDLYTGEVYALEDAKYGRGISVSGLPIRDYPLVVCDRGMVEIE